MRVGAVLLAGGRGSRLGGVDKAALRLGGETLLGRALEALEGVETVVVGPDRGLPGVRTVREHPPLSGPAAAALAGLSALPGLDEVLLLAVDLPRLDEALPLLQAAASGPDGVVAEDPAGRRQWLLGRYRAAAVRDAAGVLGDPADRSLRALLGDLRLARLRLPPHVGLDVDTVADARAAGIAVPAGDATSDGGRP